MAALKQASVPLARFAALTALATLCLIGIGGLVTSHEAGLAVPDWPNTFGYNMFFFPISKWVGGIFFEHTHRLAASAVGMLTTVLAVWIWLRDDRRWMRRLGGAAFLAVVLQGVLGGLRVTLLKDQIGVFHAALAQSFFVLVAAIALFCSPWWRRLPLEKLSGRAWIRNGFTILTALVFVQLVVAATMRHQHAGLAIPDFPAAYGRLWPATDDQSVLRYNQLRVEINGYNPITAAQIILQMTHRLIALAILAGTAWLAWRAVKSLGGRHVLSRLALVWLGLVLVQVFLGAATIWTGKSADVATAHVVVGALCLAAGGLGSVISFALLAPAGYKAGAARAARGSNLRSGGLTPKQSIS